MNNHLHIICLNVPYPVDYGGAFDLFYKLPALCGLGIKIHLHCFQYGRKEQPELNKYCEGVHYYTRQKGISGLSIHLPYIVESRKNEILLNRLLEDDYPVLMEGIHCTYLLNDKRFESRKCYVRLHNVEHIYYMQLFKITSSLFKKLYYFAESQMLLKYEKAIVSKATFWSVTKKDAELYKSIGCKNIEYLPLFLPDWKVKATEGNGSFCLYHGDLSISENEKAAIWLVDKVFDNLQIPFVVAGKNPSNKLKQKFHNNALTCLIPNPEEAEMQDLISKAHINIIPSFNATGIKLKLINALFNGRHCLVNDQTVEGTDLENLCHIAGDVNSFKSKITDLYLQPFGADDLHARSLVLDNMFDNEANAKQMARWIWQTDLD